jgi:hypothetical protein
MARLAFTALLLATGLGWSSSALAQESGFGSERPLVVSFEHLGGVSYARETPEQGDSRSIIQAGTFFTYPFFAPSAIARLGVHYFPTSRLSIGALLGYADNDQLGTLYLVGGRVGFAAPMSESTSLWIRGGALYWRNKFEFLTLELKTSAVVAGGEVLFAYEPIEHFGILVGPMFEMGWVKTTASGFSNESKSKYIEAALTVGFYTDW